MSYKQNSPLPIIEGGTGAQLFEMAVGEQGYGVIVCGQFSTDPLQVIQSPGTVGQVLTSNGISELPTWEDVSAVGVVSTLEGDTGGPISPTLGNIYIITGESTLNAGSSVTFDGAGDVITLNLTDGQNNTIIGRDAGNLTGTGQDNVTLGSANFTSYTTAAGNIVIGINSCQSLLTGENNIIMGFGSGNGLTGAESSNILLNNFGFPGESNVLRIGNGTGSDAGELDAAIICGISGANVGSVATVVTENNDQLGTAVITAGTGITVTPGANTITIAASGAVAESFSGDSGSAVPSLGVLDIKAGVASLHCGSSVSFNGSGLTIQLNVTDGDNNTIVGSGSGNGTLSGTANTVFGSASGVSLATGFGNTLIGQDAARTIADGDNNTIIGQNTAQNLEGSANTFVGQGAATNLLTGTANTMFGYNLGDNYTSNESNNILLGVDIMGTVGESHVLRIGNATGSGSTGDIAAAYICGIDGVNVGSVATVVTESGDQLGTAVITAGSGITVTPGANTITIAASGGGGATDFATDSGTATESAGTINITANNTALNCGATVLFSGTGSTVTLDVTNSDNNTIIGKNAGSAALIGIGNTILGSAAGGSIEDSSNNTIIGTSAANAIFEADQNVIIGSGAAATFATGQQNVLVGTSIAGALNGGNNHVIIGYGAASQLAGGSSSVIIGNQSGTLYDGSESNNICIGASVQGASGEQRTLRIGRSTGSTLAGQLQQAFIHGIRGITTVNNDAIAVLVDSAGQLGTVSSSAKVKHNIADMNDASSPIMNLRPVTFAYNSDPYENMQYGLIAEEVNEILPGLTAYNQDGEIESVKYHLLPVLLLNEIKKLNARIAALEAKGN